MTPFWAGFVTGLVTASAALLLCKVAASRTSGEKKGIAGPVLPTSTVTAHIGRDGAVSFTYDYSNYKCPVCGLTGTTWQDCYRPDCADGR